MRLNTSRAGSAELCPYCGCRPCNRRHACPPWRVEFASMIDRLDALEYVPPQHVKNDRRVFRVGGR